ncbi:TonB-dependent receptor plug domain-containing protein [Chitiniphilus eburneus]|uniref:TonB-dependent receptor n=1 Tax=Chitiniphilus eburneus TaxID=2571148 RepID=A0A4U0PXI6_9NEIS|nr:TonB-dependent receptor [Chitiniphilus eburneus]TJZ73301.1 TonB-dependent receptor [Chitiniphilus eburneus]
MFLYHSPFQPPFRRKSLCGLGLLSLLLALPLAYADSTLDTIVVTATRTEKTIEDAPIRTEVVTSKEIERTHARTLKEALENVPGLQLREVHGKSGYELSLQGLTSDQVLILIDGMPISASTGSTVNLSQYLLAEVDHIEVIKGAASAQYGSSAMGGVINVITRKIQPGFSGSVAGDVGSYGKQNVSGKSFDKGSAHGQARVEGGGERWRVRVDADVVDDSGFSVNPDAWARQGDASRREQYGGRLAWLPTPNSELWVEGSTYTEDDEQRYQYYAPPNYIPQRKTENIERDRIAAGGNWRFDNGMNVQLKGLDERYDSTTREYSNDFAIARRESEQTTQHVTAQVDLPAWNRQLWQFGADWHGESLTQTSNDVSELVGNGKVTRSSRELFAQNDIIFNDIWELVLGLRWQDDSDFGSHAAPKIALRGNVLQSGDWNGVLRASFGQGYRVPNLKERHYLFDHSSLGYMVLGNPDLKPESSNSWQLGGTLSFRQNVTLDVNLFLNDVKDLIQTDLDNYTTVNGVALYSYENIARARTRGVETALRWQPLETLDFSAAYTFTDARDLDTDQSLTRRPRSIARVGADWQALADTGISLRGRYQSSELVDAATNARSPAWTTWDLKINQTINRDTTVYFGVDNLFDRQRDFADASDFGPIAGRFIYLGARYTWGKTNY